MKRTMQSIPFPHNSLFVMGILTFRQDTQRALGKEARAPAERGPRISLTFRARLSTFLTPLLPPPSISQKQRNQQLIFRQGATGKTRAEAARLIVAFGEENHENGFSWGKAYGEGFDVLRWHCCVSFFGSSPAEYTKHEQSYPGGRTSTT